jgi:hypothetical protein
MFYKRNFFFGTFFCYSEEVASCIIKTVGRYNKNRPAITAWKGTVPEALCKHVANSFYRNVSDVWSNGHSAVYECMYTQALSDAPAFTDVSVDPISGDVIEWILRTCQPIFFKK